MEKFDKHEEFFAVNATPASNQEEDEI